MAGNSQGAVGRVGNQLVYHLWWCFVEMPLHLVVAGRSRSLVSCWCESGHRYIDAQTTNVRLAMPGRTMSSTKPTISPSGPATSKVLRGTISPYFRPEMFRDRPERTNPRASPTPNLSSRGRAGPDQDPSDTQNRAVQPSTTLTWCCPPSKKVSKKVLSSARPVVSLLRAIEDAIEEIRTHAFTRPA